MWKLIFIIFIFTACADTLVIYKDSSVFNDSDANLADCPDDMVAIGTICIDRFEASRIDATLEDQGTSEEQAFSKKEIMPWTVNPMTDEHFEIFKKACEASGKRLCKNNEWTASCMGS